MRELNFKLRREFFLLWPSFQLIIFAKKMSLVCRVPLRFFLQHISTKHAVCVCFCWRAIVPKTQWLFFCWWKSILRGRRMECGWICVHRQTKRGNKSFYWLQKMSKQVPTSSSRAGRDEFFRIQAAVHVEHFLSKSFAWKN